MAGSDPDNDTLTYGVATFPTNGVLSGTAPNLTYTPDAPFSGSDSFTFTVNDGFGGTDTGTVNITVIPNIFPVADDQNLTTAEDTPLPITLTGNDPDGDPVTFSAGSAANGAVTGSGQNVTYTPNANFNGTDSFTFTIADDRGGSDTGTITIVVTSVNDNPDAADQTVTVTENTPTPITLGATDADGDSIGYADGPVRPTDRSAASRPPSRTRRQPVTTDRTASRSRRPTATAGSTPPPSRSPWSRSTIRRPRPTNSSIRKKTRRSRSR